MSFEFKGKIKLEVDDNCLSARIHFTPIDTGDSYNLESLREILKTEGIVHGIDEEKLEEAAEEFSEAMEPYLSDVIAQGDPPSMGSGQNYDFSSFKYPENLEKVAEKIRSMNKAPVIFKTEKVKVQRDKRVKDKGFFKGGKEKIITVEEEKEKKVRVEVSPKVIELGFFEKGDLVCTSSSSSGEASNGKDLKGNELKAPEVVEGGYLFGNNLISEKNETLACCDGFVRKGENWLDLVPFDNHKWKIKLSDNKADCFLDVIAGHKAAPPPLAADILKAVKELGVPEESIIDSGKITQYLNSVCRSQGAQTFTLTKDRDGSYELEINSLKTEAKLHLCKGSGRGEKLNLKQAWAKVLDLKIPGLEVERIKQEILDFNGSENSEVSILIASGEDPRRGDDREIVLESEYLDDQAVENIKNRIKDKKKLSVSYSEFPFSEVQKMALVKKDMVLFRLGQKKGGKDGKDIYGKVIEGIEGNDPILNVYENIIMQDGVASAKINGILDFSCDNMVYSIRVREHTDANIVVSLAQNNMSASISFLSPQGSGEPVSLERIQKALEDKSVVKGLLQDEIQKVAQLADEGKIVTDHLVAEGKIPFQGEQTLSFLLDLEPGKKDSAPVDEGDIIAELQQQGEGDSTGYNVLGEQLFSEDDKGMEREQNVIQEEVDGKLVLKAGAKGLLCIENNRLFIKEKHTIRGDVSRSSGNVKFPGSIIISGSVLSGIFVNAGKDLTVMEVVEASLLSAGGSINIGKGVKGDRKAVLRAGEGITLGFAENTNIMVNGVLEIKKALMNCVVKCNGKISSEHDKTRIIGGSLKVKNGLSASIIGSQSEAKTLISFGQDYLVEDQISVVSKEIDQIHEQLKEMESHLVLAEEKRNQKKLMALRKKKVQMLKVLEKKGIKNFFLKEKFEQHCESEVRVSDTIFPGVTFESHGRTMEVKESLYSVIVYFDMNTGKISTKPLS